MPLVSRLHRLGQVVPVRVLSMGQIELIHHLLSLVILDHTAVYNLKKNTYRYLINRITNKQDD